MSLAPETLLNDVELAILRRLQDSGLKSNVFAISDFEDNADTIRCPAVNVAFWDGTFSSLNMNGTKLKLDALVYLTIVVQNVKDEKSKRHSVYPLVMTAASLLSGHKLKDADGVVLDGAGPLQPRRLRKTFETKSRIAFVLEVKLPLTIELQSDETAAEIMSVAMSYMIKPGDDCADAEDIVTFD